MRSGEQHVVKRFRDDRQGSWLPPVHRVSPDRGEGQREYREQRPKRLEAPLLARPCVRAPRLREPASLSTAFSPIHTITIGDRLNYGSDRRGAA
jgi:hypothetical protein